MIKACYIHIPFCNDICTYCDFCKYYYHKHWISKYLDALEKEIDTFYKGEELGSIYIGGGTPSSLSLDELKRLLMITKKLQRKDVEFTFEANIESLDEDKVKLLKEYGVNRISIGVQTFNPKYIHFLNRHHTKDMVKEKILMIKKYITNINIDLIYAIPGETLEELKEDIDTFLSLDIPHISTYSLIIEDHTALANQQIKPISEDVDFAMYQLICSSLSNYEHYEISNFGIPSKHNLTYWNNEEYYGFGLGASGYEGNIRYTNTRSLKHYLASCYRYQKEELSFNTMVENAFILGLRKISGINKQEFQKRYNIDMTKLPNVKKLKEEGHLLEDENTIKINPKDIYISNDILIDFLDFNYEDYR